MDQKLMHRALQDLEIAKQMIMTSDYVAARKMLLTIQRYFPAFDNIAGMVAVCDVLHSAGYQFFGSDIDYYWVLEVSPSATQFAIETQYNKLVSLLNPFKNNFPCAASALKITHDAFSVLSSLKKRSMFDMKRAMWFQSYDSGHFVELNSTRFDDDHIGDGNRVQKTSGFSAKFPWDIMSTTGNDQDQDQDRHEFVEDFAVGQIWAIYDHEGMPRNYAQIINIKVHGSPCRMYLNWLKPVPDTAHGKKWCEAGLPMVCGLFNVDRSRTTPIEPKSFSHRVSPNQSELVEIYPRKGEVWAIYRDLNPLAWCSNPTARHGYILQIVEILTGYSNQDNMLVAVLVKVKGLKNVYSTGNGSDSEPPFQIPGRNLYMFSHRIPAYTCADEEMFKLDPLATPVQSIPLPLSDTEPLNLKRTAEDFASNQVWAVYDGPDSMPRRYVEVNNVVSGSEICVTFLEPYPILIDEFHWIKENLPIGCGLFEAGKTKLNLKLSRFSSMVKCEKNNSFYKIFPNKGEIWAKYRNWSSSWSTADFKNYQCQIVEIVSDFCEESGLIVANLEKVAGCSTFFRRQSCDGFELVRAVPLTEMLSFSHQIPAFTVPGAEMHNVPEGSWHLEPDALPPNFSPYC